MAGAQRFELYIPAKFMQNLDEFDTPASKINKMKESFDVHKNNIDFHVESGDYFGTLATILGLVADVLESTDPAVQKRCKNTLSELREDLLYLQENYSIADK